MQPELLLSLLHRAERLKDNTRHCYTSGGRHESVAEHCWRLALMAMFLRSDFPDLDMDKVIEMCLIHDLGEAFTGDIPTFEKTDADEQTELQILAAWVNDMPQPLRSRMQTLYAEMDALQTPEAKLYKALDGMEAVIQHNESALSTWLPLEYDLQKTHGAEMASFSPVTQALREAVLQDTLKKIASGE